jgi:hypothetical protein
MAHRLTLMQRVWKAFFSVQQDTSIQQPLQRRSTAGVVDSFVGSFALLIITRLAPQLASALMDSHLQKVLKTSDSVGYYLLW